MHDRDARAESQRTANASQPGAPVTPAPTRHAPWRIVLLILFWSMPHTALAQADCVDPRASGVTVCGEADLWSAANPGASARAFDEFHPGLAAGTGCLAPPPIPALDVGTGTVAVRTYDAADVEVCALLDSSTAGGQVSDAMIVNGGYVEMAFDPPTIAFFTYFGSLATGETVTFELFDEFGSPVDTFFSYSSSNSVYARGYGFWSTVPIGRIRFTSSENGATLVGAFVGLASNTPSLGTVTIAGYQGPDDGDGVETIDLDFAAVLDDCNGNGVSDMVDIDQGTSADADADGRPDECEACLFQDDTLDCDGNGMVDGCEVPEIIDPTDTLLYPTLQDALDAACFGDRVVIGPDQTVLASTPFSGDVVVSPGTLVLEQGATLEFLVGGLLRVGQNGSLRINGTSQNPVTLMAQGEDGSTPPFDRWNGLYLEGGNTLPAGAAPHVAADIQHAQLRYMNNVGIQVEDAAVVLDAVTIDDVLATSASGDAAGIRLAHDAANLTITNSTLSTIVAADGVDGAAGQPGAAGDSAGANGSAGSSGAHGSKGGDAFGIDADLGVASIATTLIADVTAGAGGTGGAGGFGGRGADGGILNQDGGNGGWAGAGGNGGDGGDAWGIRDRSTMPASMHDVRVFNVRAGDGARAGSGGRGGVGGDATLNGSGGNGGRGRHGGKAGDGGTAWGAQSLGAAVSIHQSVIDQVRGGRGGDGFPGAGGAGGNAGSGGGALAGDGGDGGIAGSGGWAVAVGLRSAGPADIVVAQITTVGLSHGLRGNGEGAGGFAGSGGFGTNGVAGGYPYPDLPNPDPMPWGSDGTAGGPINFPPDEVPGGQFIGAVSDGSARGLRNEDAAAVTTANNVVVGASAAATFALDSQAGPVTASHNCYRGFSALHDGSGGVIDAGDNLDPGADPFVDADGADGQPGTLDDDLRLKNASPCVDAGSNPVATNLGLALDIEGNPRFSDFTGDGTTAIVDRGAYELPAPDADGDGWNDGFDNCTAVPNPSQLDGDGDGFGNRCDADLNGDCIVNPVDLGLFRSVFFTADASSDFNGDGVVNPVDLGILRSLFFLPPGPSAAGDCVGAAPTQPSH